MGTGVLGPYGRAGLATLVSLVLFAMPPIITNAYVGMRSVDREVVEAATGMGMRGSELFRRVELPLAAPLVMTGVRLALVQVWATASIAALVAGPGLGNTITLGFENQDVARVLGGGILVAGVALALEGLLAVAERFSDPVRRATSRTSVKAEPPVALAGS
jgi:osmoprotectant transport system permease protein